MPCIILICIRRIDLAWFEQEPRLKLRRKNPTIVTIMVLVLDFPYQICYTNRVTLIGRKVIDAFVQTHADAREPLAAWHHEVTNATWRAPKDIKARYPSASILPGRIVIFNIKGNHYRLEVCVAYNTGVVRIDYVGTHADYDKRNRQRGAV